MSDKSPRQSMSKKSAKSLKQKRTEKNADATTTGVEKLPASKKR